MANVLDMMKQAKQVRRMQKELAGKTVECSSGDGLVTVTARGDMSVKSIRIDPQLVDPDRPDRLAKVIAATVNAALDAAKKEAAESMAKLTGGMGALSDMLGG
ncbi:YbaB/EbfC family nucleoid-associated protein [Verrucomicrobiota bacterium]